MARFLALLAVLWALLGADAVLSSTASRRNPIPKVIAMLEALEKKVKSEGDEKQKIYDKYMCYCKKTSASLAAQLAEASRALPQLRSRSQQVAALQITLDTEIGQHRKDREDAKSAIASANEIRKRESETFVKESQGQQESLDSLGQAIRALEENQAVAFLQTSGAAVLRRLSLSADMTTQSRDLLTSFLSSAGPSSGQVLGMLKQMKEDMAADLKELKASEASRSAEHLGLVEAKRKQQEVATQSMEEKMMRLGELKVEMQVLKSDLQDQGKAQKENAEFAASLNKTCEEKQQAWSDYQTSQSQELNALGQTVEFLSEEKFQAAVRSATSLVQRSRRTPSELLEEPAPAGWSFLQTANLVDLAFGGEKRGMDEVVSRIEDLHEVLDKEQRSDEDKQRYCETKLHEAAAAKVNKEREVEDANSILATFQNELDTVLLDISTLRSRMKELDEEVAATTATRQAERQAFEKSRQSNGAALELLGVAQQRLGRFYAASMVQVAQAQGGSAPDLGYRKQSGGAQVVQLLGQIKADIEKQNVLLESEDALGQSEYENLVKNSNEKKMADNRRLGSKEAAKAELEANLQRSRGELRSLNQVLKALAEEIRSLHAQCDFLLKNFDLREDARRAERRSLTRAKAILEAA